LFLVAIIYGELVSREEGDTGFAWSIRIHFRKLALYAAAYLHDVPDPEQRVNLVDKFEFYFLDEEDYHTYIPKINSGLYAFYVSGDSAWVGYQLPGIFWTKGNNNSRKKLQKIDYMFYGSESITAPPDDSEKNHYRQENDVVWLKVNKTHFSLNPASYIRMLLWRFNFYAARYLADVSNPEQGVNLIDKFEFYFLDEEEYQIYMPKIKSGLYAFYVSGDVGWIGSKLPEISAMKGDNDTCKNLLTATAITFYGSKSIDSFPPDDSKKYRYRKEDDVVWHKVDKNPASNPVLDIWMTLRRFAFYAVDYLHDVSEPEQGINLIDKLEFYFSDDEEYSIYMPKVKSAEYAFYVIKNEAWVGYQLPAISATKGYNYTREALRYSRMPFYGSESINSLPSDDSEKYHYRSGNNAVWLKVNKTRPTQIRRLEVENFSQSHQSNGLSR
jgi:hypothetical protein